CEAIAYRRARQGAKLRSSTEKDERGGEGSGEVQTRSRAAIGEGNCRVERCDSTRSNRRSRSRRSGADTGGSETHARRSDKRVRIVAPRIIKERGKRNGRTDKTHYGEDWNLRRPGAHRRDHRVRFSEREVTGTSSRPSRQRAEWRRRRDRQTRRRCVESRRNVRRLVNFTPRVHADEHGSIRVNPWLLFTNNFHQHTFSAAAIKLAIEDLLPWAKVQLPSRDRNVNLASHYLSLDVSVSVIFAGFVVMVLADRFVRRELFQPRLVILMQPAFVIVDEDGRCDMHRIHQHQTLHDTTLPQTLLNLWRDVYKRPSTRHVKP